MAKKKLTEIYSSSVYNPKTFNMGMSKIAKNLGDPPYLAGQDIVSSSKGNVYMGDVDIHSGPSYGDVIHGANKYKNELGQTEDLDFTYRPSTRKSSSEDNVKHWTITGTRKDD